MDTSCPWNTSLQNLAIHLLQATTPVAVSLVTRIWGNWLVRGAWNHTKQHYFSLSSLIRTGRGPTQILGWISYKQNAGQKKKKKHHHGKHLRQAAHQWPRFCICIIINLICQISFSEVSSPEELIHHIKSTLCKSQRTMTALISGEIEEGNADSAVCCSYLLHKVGNVFTRVTSDDVISSLSNTVGQTPDQRELLHTHWNRWSYASSAQNSALPISSFSNDCTWHAAQNKLLFLKRKQWSLSLLTHPMHSPSSKNGINCP